MWKLTKIKATNICAFRELDYTIDQGHSTLVFGANLDNDGQGSNGSGKSALIEAIAIGFTGDSLRKVKADEIINDFANEATVVMELANNETGSSLVVERQLSRTGSQSIKILMDGNQVTMPSVNDYNKCVLDTIGISRDDLFSNYILSKHKYSSFLNASDRDKKELINRFSNGSLVDEALSHLGKDITEVKQQLDIEERAVAACQGRVDAVKALVDEASTNFEIRENRKNEIISAHNEAIGKLREKIRLNSQHIAVAKEKIEICETISSQLTLAEESSMGITEAYETILKVFEGSQFKLEKDYAEQANDIAENLQRSIQALEASNVEAEVLNAEYLRLVEAHEDIVTHQQQIEASNKPVIKDLEERINDLNEEIRELNASYDAFCDTLKGHSEHLSQLEVMLAGTITCPNCSHKFLLDGSKSIEETQREAEEVRKLISEATTNRNSTSKRIKDSEKAIRIFRSELSDIAEIKQKLSEMVQESLSRASEIDRKIAVTTRELRIERERRDDLMDKTIKLRTEMFNEAFSAVDLTNSNAQTAVDFLGTEIENSLSSITSYEEAIAEVSSASIDSTLASLQATLDTHSATLEQAIGVRDHSAAILLNLTQQEVRFKEFKTFLANTKINALGTLTNKFLEQFGSDLRLIFSAYTTLRSKKVNEKISLSVVRNGIDCGSFGKMSQGEQCRINLASILALQELTNSNCEDGKGLDLLVLDEILDATDELGLASMFDALNKLNITALIVSHGLTQENYPHKITVKKQNGISTIG